MSVVPMLYYLWLAGLHVQVATARPTLDQTCLLQVEQRVAKPHRHQVGPLVGTKCRPRGEDVLLSLSSQKNLSSRLGLDQPRDPLPDKFSLHTNRKALMDVMSKGPLGLLFYGDSGLAEYYSPLNRQTFKDYFEKPFGPSAVMAVIGDTSADLLWRLQNGEAPTRQPRAVFVNIGINDITQNLIKTSQGLHPEELADNVYLGIEAVVRQLMKSCEAKLILGSILPAGMYWPEGPYGKVIHRVNALLTELAEKNSDKMTVVDCSAAILNKDTGTIEALLAPDYLHPSKEGMLRLSECISDALQDV